MNVFTNRLAPVHYKRTNVVFMVMFLLVAGASFPPAMHVGRASIFCRAAFFLSDG